jgi:hypothetical protein
VNTGKTGTSLQIPTGNYMGLTITKGFGSLTMKTALQIYTSNAMPAIMSTVLQMSVT